MPTPPLSASALTMLLAQQLPVIPSPAEVMTAIVDLPPADPGTPPHRHSGPVFGYMLEGEMTFELEGEPERVIRAGEAFSEPGGDVIHCRAANHLSHAWTRFVLVMIALPGEPMLALVSTDELDFFPGRCEHTQSRGTCRWLGLALNARQRPLLVT
jgi:quercetin dioxygenase-like cupin family protein